MGQYIPLDTTFLVHSELLHMFMGLIIFLFVTFLSENRLEDFDLGKIRIKNVTDTTFGIG